MTIIKTIWGWVLFCIPHFSTDEAFFDLGDDGDYYPVCVVGGEKPGDHFCKVGKIKGIEWFGRGIDFMQETPLRDIDGSHRHG
jgi:hypothetical protein